MRFIVPPVNEALTGDARGKDDVAVVRFGGLEIPLPEPGTVPRKVNIFEEGWSVSSTGKKMDYGEYTDIKPFQPVDTVRVSFKDGEMHLSYKDQTFVLKGNCFYIAYKGCLVTLTPVQE